MHVQFSENTPNIARSGPYWLFDIDALTKSMNYKLVVEGNQSNGDDEKKITKEPRKEGGDSSKGDESNDQEKEDNVNNTNNVNAANTNKVNAVGSKTSIELPDDPNMPKLEDIVYSDDDDDVERINYDEVFAPVARIEAIRLSLAYASFKDFGVYQMDVKCGFLYGKIEEEVYVCQTPGFEDPDFPDRRGKIDKTLFIRRDKGEIMLVQVYVDDIIFGFTKKSLCTEFDKMMHKKFQISSMSEFTFFLGLQVKQKEDGIFISQD
ncbi:retrovirus-related pol polyprotein from transposon TNT 1-94, partial [Tanacetum coccineum]